MFAKFMSSGALDVANSKFAAGSHVNEYVSVAVPPQDAVTLKLARGLSVEMYGLSIWISIKASAPCLWGTICTVHRVPAGGSGHAKT